MRLDSDNQTKALLIELRRRRGRFSCVLCLRRWTIGHAYCICLSGVFACVRQGLSVCAVGVPCVHRHQRACPGVEPRCQRETRVSTRVGYAVSKRIVVSRLYDSDARTLTRPDSRHRVTRRETATRPRQRRRQSTRATPTRDSSTGVRGRQDVEEKLCQCAV